MGDRYLNFDKLGIKVFKIQVTNTVSFHMYTDTIIIPAVERIYKGSEII